MKARYAPSNRAQPVTPAHFVASDEVPLGVLAMTPLGLNESPISCFVKCDFSCGERRHDACPLAQLQKARSHSRPSARLSDGFGQPRPTD